jgi:hypothetical protein
MKVCMNAAGALGVTPGYVANLCRSISKKVVIV